MDSSSEGSFVWSRASTGSDDSEEMQLTMNDDDSLDGIKMQPQKHESSVTKKTKKEIKVKKRKHESVSHEYEEIDSPKKKKIKTESESDSDVKKNKKKKYLDVTNGSHDDSFCEEDIYLSMKVKQEKEYQDSSDHVKSKKTKRNSDKLSDSIEDNKTSSEINKGDENEKKSKKKKKHSKDISDNEESFVNEEDHSEENEEKLSKKSPKKKKKKELRLSEQNEFENTDSQDHGFDNDSHISQESKKNKSPHGSNDNSFYEDDNYLNMKVKQEKEYQDSSNHVKSKKSKRNSDKLGDSIEDYKIDSEINKGNENGKKSKKKKKHSKDISDNEESFVNREDHSEVYEEKLRKKSPKKKKRKELRLSEQIEFENIEDKFTAEDTVIQKRSNMIPTEHKINGVVENDNSCNSEEIIEQSHDENNPTNNKKNKKNTDSQDHGYDNDVHMSQESKKNKATGKITSRRKSTLTDRIQFEDEVEPDSMLGSYQISQGNDETSSSHLRRYLRENSNLQPISKLSNKDLEVTDDDEIWILKCPHDIDINELNNSDINLDNKSKIKINSNTFCGALNDCLKINVMSSDEHGFKIKNLVPNGIIHFRKRLPKPHFHEDNVMVNNQTDFIPLPETKCRHPLFGSNYKDSIHVPIERLKSSSNDLSLLLSCDKKKKKKYKKEYGQEEIQPKIECDLKVSIKETLKIELDSDVPVKKAKKRKHTNNDEHKSKKSKRIKLEPDSAEAWASEKAIEENLFNF